MKYDPYEKGFKLLLSDYEKHESEQKEKSDCARQMAIAAREHLDANEFAQAAYYLDEIAEVLK